jgi:hypothetical protein
MPFRNIRAGDLRVGDTIVVFDNVWSPCGRRETRVKARTHVITAIEHNDSGYLTLWWGGAPWTPGATATCKHPEQGVAVPAVPA